MYILFRLSVTGVIIIGVIVMLAFLVASITINEGLILLIPIVCIAIFMFIALIETIETVLRD